MLSSTRTAIQMEPATSTGSTSRPQRKFLNKNSLCGGEDTQWMVTYASGKSLQLAFFSGQEAPVFTFDAISKSTNLCGTFSYAK